MAKDLIEGRKGKGSPKLGSPVTTGSGGKSMSSKGMQLMPKRKMGGKR